MKFTKKALSVSEQICQLGTRGLNVKDKITAGHHLLNIGYYRLSGYWWPMQSDKVKHIFKADSCFLNVIYLYKFDRKLRLIVFEIIEQIEISLRTKMTYYLSQEIGPWWFED